MEGKPLVPLSVLVAEEQRHDYWIVEDMIRPGDIVQIAEEAKGGKTTFIAQLLAAISRGDEFLGRATVSCRVVYLGAEDRAVDLQRMFAAHGLMPQEMLVARDISDFALPSPGGDNLVIASKELHVNVIVLDPITDFIQHGAFGRDGFDENDAMNWQQIMGTLSSVARQTGAVIVFTRHKSKAMSGGRSAGATSPGRGSNYPETKASVLMNLTKCSGGWKLTIKGKGVRRQDLSLVSGDGQYTFRLTDSAPVSANASSTAPLASKGDLAKAATALRTFVEQNGGEVSGEDMEAQMRRLKGLGLKVPMRGPQREKLLQLAGMEHKRSRGRSLYRLADTRTQSEAA